MRLFYLTFLFCILSFFAYTQNFKTQPLKNAITSWKDSASLHFEFTNTNFFKNNEYSNNILNGYTLIGFNATPKLSYYLSGNTKITGGINLLKYFGKENFHEIKPVFRIHRKFNPQLSLIIGSIDNSNCHALTRPLYHPEILLKDPTEYGLQFLFQNRRFDIDLWLDWQRFITKKSDFQEEFITGISSESRLLTQNAPIEVYIPFQMLIKHKGGQIGDQEQPVSTISNAAIGVGARLPIATDNNFLQFENFITGYNKITDKSNEPFNKGAGLYSKLKLRINAFDFNFSYWRGSKFITIAGDPIYQSYSLKENEKLPEKEILEAGLRYTQNFPHSKFTVNFKGLYDLMNNSPDYYVGLYLYVDFDRIVLKP